MFVRETRTARKTPAARTAFIAILAAIVSLGMGAASLPAFAQMATPAPGSSTTTTAKPKRTPTPGQIAARERQKKCAAEWKTDKAAGKIEKGMKWPKYWSACNKRLKAAS